MFHFARPCLAIGKMDDNQNVELPAKVWANFSMMQILQTQTNLTDHYCSRCRQELGCMCSWILQAWIHLTTRSIEVKWAVLLLNFLSENLQKQLQVQLVIFSQSLTLSKERVGSKQTNKFDFNKSYQTQSTQKGMEDRSKSYQHPEVTIQPGRFGGCISLRGSNSESCNEKPLMGLLASTMSRKQVGFYWHTLCLLEACWEASLIFQNHGSRVRRSEPVLQILRTACQGLGLYMSYLRESNINRNGLAHYNTFQTSKDKQPQCRRQGQYSIQSLLQGFQG